MSVNKARRLLHAHGTDGNWRFKGLLLAALPESGVSASEVAQAWPSSGHPSTYRFLGANPQYDPKAEAERKVVAEQGEDTYRLMSDYANEDGLSKRLGASKPDELDGGKRLGSGKDDYIKRTLFATSTVEEVDTLFREQLVDVVMNGAERRKIAREASNVINAQTRRGDVPVAQDETYSYATAEGAEIRDDAEDYTTVPFDTQKYGMGARITDEMVDHAMVDIIERQIEYLGAAVENSINRVWLTNLIDNAQNNHDTTGSNQGVQAINAAYGEVDSDDFIPDTFVTHPEYRTTLFDDDNIAFANRAGTDDVIRERVFDPLLSVEHYGSSDSTYDPDGSATWGFAADGELGAVVYDRNHVHTVLYSPDGNGIQVKDYDDPIRDLRGVNARVHVDSIYSQGRAASTVEY